MKQCPRCNKTYSDDSLNFCLDDGELLMAVSSRGYADDAPPTVLLDQSRVTNPTNWPNAPQAGPVGQWQPQGVQNQPFGAGLTRKRDQTLPTIALVLGILSLILVCCFSGFWLGLPAAVVGFLGMRNADTDPQRYTGRGMAIAGMVLGVIGFLSTIVYLLIAIANN